jgi:hypothetical protein
MANSVTICPDWPGGRAFFTLHRCVMSACETIHLGPDQTAALSPLTFKLSGSCHLYWSRFLLTCMTFITCFTENFYYIFKLTVVNFQGTSWRWIAVR